MLHNKGSYLPEGTESESRAAMLIFLLENKYVSSSEVNERLQSA